MTGTILMILGAILLLTGFVVRNSNNKTTITADTVSTNIPDSKDINKEKGNDFEAFIVKMFNAEYFSLKEWAGDKYVDGIYAESTLNPDLIYEFKYKSKNYPLAVECKYRASFKDDKIVFSYPEQLERYKEFEKEKKIPVFIAVGVGGSAKSPKELFIIPLRNITSTTLYRDKLAKYAKDPESEFKYYFKSKKLY